MRSPRARLLGLGLALAALGARPASADEPRAEARAWVAITTSRDTVYVGEPIALRLEFGLDEAWFEEHAVPLVRQPMDLPVLVLAPAMGALPGAVRRSTPPARPEEPPPKRFVLDDGPALARFAPPAESGGRTFSTHRVDVEFLPTEPGVLVVPPPVLRFAYATRFEQDFARGRLPLDRTEVRIVGTAPSIRVRPLPEEGRPAGFSGAVGRFTTHAALDPSPPTGGPGVRLVLRIEGEGNLEAFDTPSLAGLPGFHVYGALDDRGRDVRTIRYDLAPVREGVAAVPPIALETFDPRPPAGYRTVTTSPVALGTPLPAAAAVRHGEAPAPGGDAEGKGSGTWGARGALVAAAAAAILAALGYGLRRRRRVRAEAAADPVRARLRSALGALHAWQAARGSTDPSDAFAELLAARLDCPAAAAISPDLASRLAAAGVGRDDAAHAAAVVERLVAARYGGTSPDAPPEDLLALAERVAAGPGPREMPPTRR